MRETYEVEIMHTDSPMRYKHDKIVSVHEEGSYTVLWKENGDCYRFATKTIFRIKVKEERHDKTR